MDWKTLLTVFKCFDKNELNIRNSYQPIDRWTENEL